MTPGSPFKIDIWMDCTLKQSGPATQLLPAGKRRAGKSWRQRSRTRARVDVLLLARPSPAHGTILLEFPFSQLECILTSLDSTCDQIQPNKTLVVTDKMLPRNRPTLCVRIV